MKKAREIEIPDNRLLTWDEYNDFNEHALNSSIWYASSYSRNSKQVRDKLYRKGYPEDEVSVLLKSGETIHRNMVEDAIERLIEVDILNDKRYATSIINIEVSKGLGLSRVKSSLYQKGVESELIDELLEEMDLEDKIFSSIEKAADRVLRSSAYNKLEEGFKRNQRMTQQLLSKGFSFDDISNWREYQEEKDDEINWQ